MPLRKCGFGGAPVAAPARNENLPVRTTRASSKPAPPIEKPTHGRNTRSSTGAGPNHARPTSASVGRKRGKSAPPAAAPPPVDLMDMSVPPLMATVGAGPG